MRRSTSGSLKYPRLKPAGGTCWEWNTRLRMSGSASAPPTHCSDVHLKVAFQDVGVHRGELIGADVEIDAHLSKVLLDDGGLQP